jgi:tRNA (guanine10-N2)-dimethyltransferase
MNNILVLFTGENSTIPASEAIATLRAYDNSPKVRMEGSRIMIAKTEAPPECLMKRLAYARVVGIIIEDTDMLKNFVKGKKIRWKGYSIGKEKATMPDWFERLEAEISLTEPDYEVATVVSERRYDILTVPKLMRRLWRLRRPRAREFFHPSAIYPKLARAMVNMTELKEDAILLDPFAGTGSILIEAFTVGINPIGIDISEKMTYGMIRNMKFFSQEWLGVIRADSRRIPLIKVDGIATDIPYGRTSKTYSIEPERVLEGLIGQAQEILEKNEVMVVMHPSKIDALGEGFKVEQKHYIYVHRNLTRVITIMRRR